MKSIIYVMLIMTLFTFVIFAIALTTVYLLTEPAVHIGVVIGGWL